MSDKTPAACADRPAAATDNSQQQHWQSEAACQAWSKPTDAKPTRPDSPPSTAADLPHLSVAGLTDKPAPSAGAAPADRPAPSTDAAPAQTPQPGRRQSWTVAVDLTTDLANSDDPAKQFGAHSQFRQLSDLAAQTAGKDVTMVVQVPHDPATGHGDPSQMIDRYVIRDGKIEKIDSQKTQGMAANLQHLLELSTSIAPSDKIGLICQSHGSGVMGIGGGTGSTTMEQLTDAVKNGLKGSGHDKVDVLNFDSCEMSTAPVLAKASKVASMVVASEEPEHAGEGHDGQKLTAVISDLLQHPGMSAKELSDDFVHAADRGANGKPVTDPEGGVPHTGTDTLASFDAGKYKEFSGALDGLGAALSKASQDERDRDAIRKIVDARPILPLDPKAPKSLSDRDVAGFCRSLKDAIQSGAIKDADGSIQKSADAVLTAGKDLTSAFHAEHAGGFDTLGGLDTFMPGTETRDDRAKAAASSPLKRLADLTSPSEIGGAYDHRKEFQADLDFALKEAAKGLSPEGQKALKPLLDAFTHIKGAASEAAFEKSYAELYKATTGLAGSAAERDILDRGVRMLRPFKDRLVGDRDVPDVPHWNHFVHELAGVA